jgi:LPXTG-motif cell wall-anchored protein
MFLEGGSMRRFFAALAIVVAGAIPASAAIAASVTPIPVPPGAQSCRTIAARFGVDPSTWSEIRFTDPTNQSLPAGSHTKSTADNTVTITLTARGTLDFVSLQPIEAVYVNKGNGPTSANAIYRYVPPVLRDTDLGLKPVTLSGVDHVLLCWAKRSPASTASTSTTTSLAVPTTSSAGPSVLGTSTSVTFAGMRARPSAPSSSWATTATLPATGGGASPSVIAGIVLVLAGLVVLLARRAIATDDGS